MLPEAMIRALNQDNLNQTGRDLSMYVPQKKCGLDSGAALHIEPRETKARPLLKGVGDREQSGQKAWLLLSLKLRCWFRADDLHSMWNDTRSSLAVVAASAQCSNNPFGLVVSWQSTTATGNSLVRAGLGVTMLKATLLANFSHGPLLPPAIRLS